MSVEEELIEHGVEVGERFCQPGETCGRDLLQGGLVSLKPNAADIEEDPVLPIHRG